MLHVIDNGIYLYQGDCIEAMKLIDPDTVDLVVTSPPYDAEKAYEGSRDFAAYKQFAEAWTDEIPRLMKPNASFWLNVGYTKHGDNSAVPLTYLYYSIVDLPMVQEVVWHYEGGMSYKRRFTHRTERWQWFAKDPNNLTFNLDDVRDASLNRTVDKRNNPLGKNPTDYWFFNRVTNVSEEKTAHPCQFPESMIERIVKACSNPGDTVFDPFNGAGTTGVVCKRLGRQYIGIERDPKYIEVSLRRFDAAEAHARKGGA